MRAIKNSPAGLRSARGLWRAVGTSITHILWIVVVGLFGVQGCAGPEATGGETYATVEVDVERRTETARQQNARAAELVRGGEYDEAETLLKEALTADVAFGPAHNNLGKVYFQTGRLYLAAWEFQYAAKLMPHHPGPKNNLGLVFERVGKYDDAVAQYEGALGIEADNPEFLGNLARARVRRGDRGGEVADLLEDVALKDTRPEWVAWARERLHTLERKETQKK